MDTEFSAIVNVSHLKIQYNLNGSKLVKKGCYSIEIKCGEEVVLLTNVADSYQEAKVFFDMLVYGTVTPVTAEDVFEDWKYMKP